MVVLVLLGDLINKLVWVTSVCWVTTVASYALMVGSLTPVPCANGVLITVIHYNLLHLTVTELLWSIYPTYSNVLAWLGLKALAWAQLWGARA